MSAAVKRACDACHRRKVKCDGINPCRNCSTAQLTCTYNAIPQKKGPKGSRAKVISELRETQRATSLSAKVHSRLNGLQSPPCTPSLTPNVALLSNELIKDSIEFFFANMYPIMPVLNRHRLEQQALYIEQNLESYCLLTSLCAFVLLQPGMAMPGNDPLFDMPGANIHSSQLLLEEALRVRKGYDYTANPSLSTLCTSYFIYGCYYALEAHEKAWFHLREATTLAHIIGMTQEDKYVHSDPIDSPRMRRLYWLIFVAERSYALKYNRPLSLPANINPPTLSDDPADPLIHHLHGFVRLVNLFRPFDDTFMVLWNKTRNEYSPFHLSALQKQAQDHLQHSAYMNGAEAHDMRTNQQWLKAVCWNLIGCVPSGEDMACQYQLDMSRDVVGLTSKFQTPSAGLLGVPLEGKLLDMACGMADVLSMQPSSGDPFAIGPQQHLQQLLHVVSLLRSGHHDFLPLLLSKVHDVLPRLANPMLQRVPDNMCNLDIFDGFGNAGMAQTPVMTDYKAEQFKTEPYTPQSQQQPMSRMDDMATDSGSSSNGAAPAEMGNSPFPNMNVGSPQVVSPGMDYEHNGHQQQPHLGEYNPIPNLVMGSMGQSSNSQPPQHAQQQQQPPPPQQQPPQQLPGFQAPQGLAQSTHSMHTGQMQNSNGLHGQMNHGLGHNSMGHPPTSGPPSASGHTQPYNHMMMSNLLNRQPPARQNSFSMHPQGPPQIPRTVGDFHALQRNNSDSVSTISSLSMNPLSTEMDFSGGLR